MPSSPKIVTVFGATGNQGGSVMRSLLANKDAAFQVRAITRTPDSEKARCLLRLGVEVVKADGWKKEEMIQAFKGSWGAFVNINSEDPMFTDPGNPNEIDLGKIIVDSAAEAGVKHFVFSSAESSAAVTDNTVICEAFDSKNAIEKYARAKTEFATFTPIIAGYYLENFLDPEYSELTGGFPFKKDEEGFFTLIAPKWGGKEDIPFVSIWEDFGDHVHAILLNPDKYNGKVIASVSQVLSFDGLVQAFENSTQSKARYIPMASWREFPTYGVIGLEHVKQMFGVTYISGGLYYGFPTEDQTATELKEAAVKAKGKSGNDAKLLTAEEFFRSKFGAV